MSKMVDFVSQYLETALWASNNWDDMDAAPFDKDFNTNDFSLDAIKKANDDCDSFVQLCNDANINLDDVSNDWGQHGHDFWLTRNRHGAGFWDRGYGPVGDELTDLAHSFGECNPFVNDNGRIEL